MSIATTARHGRTLEALSRVAVLLVEHRDEIPPVYISVDTWGLVRLQVTAGSTFDEATRAAAVEFIARTLHLDPPTVADVSDHHGSAGHYGTSGVGWSVFTPVHHDRCPNCSKPVVR